MKEDHRNIIIIGSVRSGTNMLRDILVKMPNYATWDCDEINPIWRHGNLNYPHDELSPEMATPKISKFIRNEFAKIARRYKVQNVVEKTTATSLRVAYAHKIFPDAKYIFIYRDGRDVAISAQKKWTAPFDLRYSLKKFRYVPISDMPYIAYYYLYNRLKKVFQNSEKLSTWGPRYVGIDEDVRNRSLLQVCALQWRHFVGSSLSQMGVIDPENLIKISYEDFVTNPKAEIETLLDYLGEDSALIEKYNLTDDVKVTSIGNWKKLNELDQKEITEILTPTLRKLSYKI